MHRLIVLNGSIKQIKAEPFNYSDGKSLAQYLEEGWSVANQLTWGDHLVVLLERIEHRASQNGTTGATTFSIK